MKKKLDSNPIYWILLLFCLFSCRTEDNVSDTNTNNQLYIQKFPDKDLAKTFEYNYYEQLNKKNNNTVPKFQGNVEFRLPSQLIKYENGDRSLIFPVINEKKLSGLFEGLISKDEKQMFFRILTENDYEGYYEAMKVFKEAYKKKLKDNSSSKLSLTATLDLLRCKNGTYKGPDKLRCKIEFPHIYEIEEVIIPGITKPDPLKPITNPTDPFNPGIGIPIGPNISLSSKDIEMLIAKDPIKDLKKFFECLDKSKPANLTVYAERGTIGHAFISISQGNNTSTFGFYPTNRSPHPKTALGPGTLNDDGNHIYDTYYNVGQITPSQLTQILNLANEYHNKMYDLLISNCTHFGKDVLNIIGKDIGIFTEHPNFFSNNLTKIGGVNTSGNAPKSTHCN